MIIEKPQFITIGDDHRNIAYHHHSGVTPGIFWLSGYRADMNGTKALALDEWGRAHNRQVTRMDYSGHGHSSGQFEDGTISRWSEEALAVFESVTEGPQIIVGSSMGGWIALLLAKKLLTQYEAADYRIHALILIAPATDFTQDLIWAQLPEEKRTELMQNGQINIAYSRDDPPNFMTRTLIEDGAQHCLLNAPIDTGKAPIHILQGAKDPVVPYNHAFKLADCLAHNDVNVSLIKDGEHNLSRPQDIEKLIEIVSSF